MSSSSVRGIILRAMFEPDFHNKLVSNPDEALTAYDLSPEEAEALKNPSAALYKLIQPGVDVLGPSHASLLATQVEGPPPQPSVIITVIVVVAITVFAAAVSTGQQIPGGTSRYSTLIDAIQQSSGAARMDLVKTLISELTKGQ